MTTFSVLLFENTAPLDVFGPVQVIGLLEKKYSIQYYSENGGLLAVQQSLKIETQPLSDIQAGGVLFIPGGFGTRTLVENEKFITLLGKKAARSDYVLTVCTGTALLARTGLIDNKNATTNKAAFEWVADQNNHVHWIKKARWVKDGIFYSSSGVSAGIDMVLGFVADMTGIDIAKKIAQAIEYRWNEDMNDDPFCLE